MMISLGEVAAASSAQKSDSSPEILSGNDLDLLSSLAAEPFDIELTLERLMTDAYHD